jgi:phenylacetate-CoA ligase
VLFPFHERLKGHVTMRMLREMEREQWIPDDELRELRAQRLRRLVSHAFRSVPYYSNIAQVHGLSADHFRTEADLERLPLLSKELIRGRLEAFKSSDARNLQCLTTGGSTGSPLAFYLGPTRISSDIAARCRSESWWGVGIGDREYVIWGSPLELTKQDRLRELRDRVLRTKLLSAFEMNEQTMDRFIDEILVHGCARVFGYPSSIHLLCEHARRRNKDLSKAGVRTVFVTAEYLWEHWRQNIAESFGCPVANGYGGRDSGFIAHECPARGMHITADRLIVEIVDHDGQLLPRGQLGEIVVTHLDTPEMPFIRYRTGDMGALSARTCACGRTLPLLENIDGRKSDFIATPDGRRMHGLSLIYALRKIAGIDQFQIVQKSLTFFEVALVTNAAFSRQSEAEIKREFRHRIRAEVDVTFRHCEEIPVTPSGKYRYVISQVEQARNESEARLYHLPVRIGQA